MVFIRQLLKNRAMGKFDALLANVKTAIELERAGKINSAACLLNSAAAWTPDGSAAIRTDGRREDDGNAEYNYIRAQDAKRRQAAAQAAAIQLDEAQQAEIANIRAKLREQMKIGGGKCD
jgi:hypothetical protein